MKPIMIMKALANERRLAMVRLLSHRRELTVQDMADRLRLSLTATSKHLWQLARADIVDRRQTGSFVYYRLVRPASTVIKAVLDTF